MRVKLIDPVRLFHPMAQYVGLAIGVPFPSLLTMLYGPSYKLATLWRGII